MKALCLLGLLLLAGCAKEPLQVQQPTILPPPYIHERQWDIPAAPLPQYLVPSIRRDVPPPSEPAV